MGEYMVRDPLRVVAQVGTDGRGEDEPDLALLEEITRPVAHARLGPAVRDKLESERGSVVQRRLPGVSDVELDVIGSIDRKRVLRRRRDLEHSSSHGSPPRR
jgi:hypothetical protein